jgi:sirohydrochlorin ferrochelatase
VSSPEAGIIVFAHGSRIESANEAVRVVCRAMAEAGGHRVEAAFLELGDPDLHGAIGRLASAGCERAIVIPYFLTLGLHMQRDLPDLVRDACDGYPNMEIQVTPPLDGHPGLVGILLDRAESALNGNKP